MPNYWMIPRPKRKLLSVVDVLSAFSLVSLDQLWRGERGTQLSFEEELERVGVKAPGPRRDQGGSGARTYESWLHCLGLIFTDGSGFQRLTLAGEALLNGEPPVPIITNQLLKFQYPSTYSTRSQVAVDPRFRVHPFRFILAVLRDGRIRTLSKAEIARFVITFADDDDKVDEVAEWILRFRSDGDAVLPPDFPDRFPPRGGEPQSLEETLDRLEDVANTFINFIEYTQLVVRDLPSLPIYIDPDRLEEVDAILATDPGFIPRPEDEEYFQRRYGLDPSHTKDTRRFTGTRVTAQLYARRLVMDKFLKLSAVRPITRITTGLVDEISHITGINRSFVEETLGAVGYRALGAFQASYLAMSRAGKEEARDFEIATQQIFGPDGFGLHADHIGTKPLHPDVLVVSDREGYSGIIDAKAYASYGISNDHRNVMIHNYIPRFRRASERGEVPPLAFWGYVAGGLKSSVGSTIISMSQEAGIPGFAVTAQNLIRLLDRHRQKAISHYELKSIFGAGGVIGLPL